MAEIINVELEQEVELQTSYELSGGIIPTGTINITTNGTHDVTTYASANVNVQGGITPTGTKEIEVDAAGTITEDVTNYASVEVAVPQGQYKPNIDATPTNPSISVSNSGLITAEVMTQYVNDLLKPSFTEGYVKSSDVSMKVKIGGSATQQLNTVNGQTVTPTTSTQYIAVQGDYVLGAINVAPIPSQYIIPTGTKSISANGTGIDVTQYASVDVNVSSASGLVYETGTYTPTQDTNNASITFSNTHSESPMMFAMFDISESSTAQATSRAVSVYFDFYRLTGVGTPYATNNVRYSADFEAYRNGSNTISNGITQTTYNSDNATASNQNYSSYWANATRFQASYGTTRTWRAGRNYKWIAVWKPTT